MTTSLSVLAVQASAFTLGCAAIHAARNHAAVLTRWLTGAAAFAAALLVSGTTMIRTPDDQAYSDEVAIYAAIAHHPPQTR
ncbi:hypothetical protein Q8W71_31485 [Methylobacterium sp. NEAU 140]|uniref:hypothetical protein n=1 Tax=Methylobacterium sp. NEAU 140 TaxID=3064945 RepID=UPI0027360776|nr:hypothetical protein [Methylobacterium sp. NEAU 140]MDP4027109.1 hypothetical protein [Methylobacterium sp. NEAU 140]